MLQLLTYCVRTVPADRLPVARAPGTVAALGAPLDSDDNDLRQVRCPFFMHVCVGLQSRNSTCSPTSLSGAPGVTPLGSDDSDLCQVRCPFFLV